jgi:hypothetical protein
MIEEFDVIVLTNEVAAYTEKTMRTYQSMMW